MDIPRYIIWARDRAGSVFYRTGFKWSNQYDEAATFTLAQARRMVDDYHKGGLIRNYSIAIEIPLQVDGEAPEHHKANKPAVTFDSLPKPKTPKPKIRMIDI